MTAFWTWSTKQADRMAAQNEHRLSEADEELLYACVTKFWKDKPVDRINTIRSHMRKGKISLTGQYGPLFYEACKLEPGGPEHNKPHVVVGVGLYGLLPKRIQDWLLRVELNQVGLRSKTCPAAQCFCCAVKTLYDAEIKGIHTMQFWMHSFTIHLYHRLCPWS